MARAHELGEPLPIVSRQWSLQAFRERHEVTYGPGRLVAEEWPERNVHSDHSAARREGLPQAVAAAPQVISQVTRMMMSEFGEGWIRGGRISVKMIKPVFPQELTVAYGRVVGKSLEETRDGTRVRVHCDVRVETLQGKLCLVGTASCLE